MSNAQNIYGPLVAILKDKSTRSDPMLVMKDDVHIPSKIYKKNSIIDLCIEVVFINVISFPVSIDRQLKYRSIIHITYHNEEKKSKVLTKYSKSKIQQDSQSFYFMQTMDLNCWCIWLKMGWTSP